MADLDELDGVLRDAFARAAQPGDPSGVADAIRSRIAGGDIGTPASGSTAPGFGGAFSWLPWIGVIVAAGVVGTTLGATGVFGSPIDDLEVVGYSSVLDGSAPAAACPGGPVVATLGAGTRVLTVQRSDDSAWLGVRNPNDVSDVLWLASAHLVIDQAQAAVSSLPVGEACPEVIVATPAPAPAPEPGPVPPPAPAKDTTKPTIIQASASPSTITSESLAETSTISAQATDNVGVAKITASWPAVGFIPAGARTITGASGGFLFGPIIWGSTTDYDDKVVPFTLIAHDAAGNVSAPVVVYVTVEYFFG